MAETAPTTKIVYPIIQVEFRKKVPRYLGPDPNLKIPYTPFGLGRTKHNMKPLASYTGEQLAAGEAAADVARFLRERGLAEQAGKLAVPRPGTRPGATAVKKVAKAPRPTPPKKTVPAKQAAPEATPAPAARPDAPKLSGRPEIIRPIEDEDVLGRLARLRGAVEKVMHARGIKPKPVSPAQAEGASILQESVVNVARHTNAVGKMGTRALLERVTAGQPPSAGEPHTTTPGMRVRFFDGPPGARRAVGLEVQDPTLNEEARSAITTVHDVIAEDSHPPHIHSGGALIMLAGAEFPGLDSDAQAVIIDKTRESGILGMPIPFGRPVNHLGQQG